MSHETFEHRPHLEDPEHISTAVDTIVSQLASRENIQSAAFWLIDRQAELYRKHRELRAEGRYLVTKDEQEIDEINFALLNVQHIFEKYHPTEE